jgi:micrococcal nuclease
MRKTMLAGLLLAGVLAGCNLDESGAPGAGGPPAGGETGRVVTVIDGDTIDVVINGQERRVRYIGINTPERDELCYSEARAANAALVRDQVVTLVRDQSETDRFGRLLRYIYVGDVLVNERLVAEGWAESVEYPPDTGQAANFRALEQAAARANLGCHPTGIFNDGSLTR